MKGDGIKPLEGTQKSRLLNRKSFRIKFRLLQKFGMEIKMKKDIKKTIAAKKCESNFIHLSITASKAIALPYQLKSKAITLLYLK
ncbi:MULTISPECIES: hypothetical protein [unclassified Pedobacter]|uniref:hypothetical protein n=1 Tax=unclassified Pedobacter TaxID=2628915 RepID=UPI00142469BA|nr:MULTISPECIES: hypothetical protein [unclassified Pedobacter]NII85840.1 hypothetical protein [Pedobacter sp. SG908]NMN39246.1 hypothetical protein [Pedobacter sp. SG918]